MSPLIRQFLSPTVLKSLVKRGGYGFDLKMDVIGRKLKDIRLGDQWREMKLDRFGALFGGGGSNISEIPPVREEEPAAVSPAAARKAPGLTDAEIEEAIDLLFEYFEQTLALLKGTLNDASACSISSSGLMRQPLR